MNYRHIDIKSIDQLILEKLGGKEEGKKEDTSTRLEEPKDSTKLDDKDIDINSNIFKNILFFTNTREVKNNKSLKILQEAISNIKKNKGVVPKLSVFEVDTVDCEELNEYTLKIFDEKESLELTSESNSDTLVFSRLTTVEYQNAIHVIQLLQDRGFLILNPIKQSKLAIDKYDTAILLEKADLPQPNFSLVTKDIIYDEKLWKQAKKDIHGKDLKDDDEKNEDLEYVCKILDGHGGCGVFMATDKSIMSILQTLFEVNPDCKLLLQRKEEADGGDIRVHVLTLMNNEQYILGAMKRLKLGGDFRSNVSLGATAEKVTLTPEQEELALKTAALSQLPWCAVDIMPLVKGSNKELGDNVILEINSSPGTDGISEVLDKNFMNILISRLNNPRNFDIQEKVCGYKETVYIIPNEGDEPIELLATVDTGNGSECSHFEVNKFEVKGDNIEFKLGEKIYLVPHKDKKTSLVGKEKYEREIVEIYEIKMGPRCLRHVDMGIVVDRDKSTNVLINRGDISGLSYVVSASKTHILTPEMDKVQILPE